MELLLAILSGASLWLFLIVLILFLDRIRSALAGIDVSLSKVTMGVRAIEVETAHPAGRAADHRNRSHPDHRGR